MRGRNSLAFAFIVASFLAVPGFEHWPLQPSPALAATKPALSEREALTILEKLDMRDARVLSIRPSPVEGLWEVGIENRGRRFVMYVDSSKRFVSPGPFIDYASRKDITKERIAELNRDKRVDVSKLSLKDALVIGNSSAPIKVVVFTDPG